MAVSIAKKRITYGTAFWARTLGRWRMLGGVVNFNITGFLSLNGVATWKGISSKTQGGVKWVSLCAAALPLFCLRCCSHPVKACGYLSAFGILSLSIYIFSLSIANASSWSRHSQHQAVGERICDNGEATGVHFGLFGGTRAGEPIF
jgi:hypothetical protein